jgi:DNA-binding PadR family transcriptional regulator
MYDQIFTKQSGHACQRRGWGGPASEVPERAGHACGRHGQKGFARGFGFGGRGGFGHGFTGGRERLFDAGDIKLAILKLLSEQPSYGYQLIKTMEHSLGGGYTPSPGVIYPTLTMLEEEGLVAVSVTEGSKKVYALTPEGVQHLDANSERVNELFQRLEHTGEQFRRGRSPELMKAFMNLRSAVMARVARQSAGPELIQKIAQTIDQAARTIDEL